MKPRVGGLAGVGILAIAARLAHCAFAAFAAFVPFVPFVPFVSAASIVTMLSIPAFAGTGLSADDEIRALLDRVAASGCEFNRNGRVVRADRAREFLEAKWRQVSRQAPVAGAEDFIRRVASRSETSGRQYRVACAGRAESDSGAWLTEALIELRGRSK